MSNLSLTELEKALEEARGLLRRAYYSMTSRHTNAFLEKILLNDIRATFHEEYLAPVELKDNSKCPNCGSIHLFNGGGDVDTVGGQLFSVHTECDDCDANWWEYYRFSHIEGFQIGRD